MVFYDGDHVVVDVVNERISVRKGDTPSDAPPVELPSEESSSSSNTFE